MKRVVERKYGCVDRYILPPRFLNWRHCGVLIIYKSRIHTRRKRSRR